MHFKRKMCLSLTQEALTLTQRISFLNKLLISSQNIFWKNSCGRIKYGNRKPIKIGILFAWKQTIREMNGIELWKISWKSLRSLYIGLNSKLYSTMKFPLSTLLHLHIIVNIKFSNFAFLSCLCFVPFWERFVYESKEN